LIGSTRRECTDHLLLFNAEHLRRILAKYATYYNEVRTTFRSGRMRPADGPSNGSAILTRIRSLADYTIAMLESSFRKRQLMNPVLYARLISRGLAAGRCAWRDRFATEAGTPNEVLRLGDGAGVLTEFAMCNRPRAGPFGSI
jgi:hypothetical protein